jgi:hypothetical protein
MSGTCRYCGSNSYGSCSRSPHKKHEHVDDEKHCVFCGSNSYGTSCTYSPFRSHQHGGTDDKHCKRSVKHNFR